MRYLSLALLLASPLFVADAEQLLNCLMKRPYQTMLAPPKGFVWLEDEMFDGACRPVAANHWIRLPSKTFDLAVYADGPSGSGRFWTVTVGIARKQEATPQRGFCLTASTVGWRTLLGFKGEPLPWIEDRDGNGSPELIIWDSFPLTPDASQAEYGLVAWVYQVDSNGRFALDWKLSRTLASELAVAYRSPPGLSIRARVAEALEAFASGGCRAGTERSP